MFPPSIVLPGLKTTTAAMGSHASEIWEARAVESLNDALLLSNNLSAKIQAALAQAKIQSFGAVDAAFIPLCRHRASREFI